VPLHRKAEGFERMSISSVAPGQSGLTGAFDPLRDLRALAAGHPAPPPTPGQALSQQDVLRKAEVSSDAAQARANPMFQAQDTRKTQARAKLQQIREWLNIVKKLYAQNPQGMARALAQVFKDLKAAVHEYEDAGGREMGMADEATASVVSPAPAAPETAPKTADAKPEEGKSGDAPAAEAADGVAATDETTDTSAPDAAKSDTPATPQDQPPAADPSAAQPGVPTAAPSNGAALYGAVVGEVRKSIGEDGMSFLKEVRQMTQAIKDLLASAKIQAAGRRHDKKTDEAFKDADKALKELNDEMDQSEQDIRQAAPDVGMKLSVVG
jgi:hypothetical protein